MTKKKILICDDTPEIETAFKNALKRIKELKNYFEEPLLVCNDDLAKAIDALEIRLKDAKDGKIKDYPIEDAAKIFDDAAVLAIDYSLFDLDASITGERIAYLARCYSKCGIIIAMNQYPPYVEEYFDLTLRGHLESYADLNIPSGSLNNPGLWLEPWNGFRPWSWPLIPNSIEKLDRRINELKGHLDKKCLEFLGFTGVKALTLPRSITEFLSRDRPEDTTFREFVNSAGSGHGLRGRKEQPINDDAITRIAAARISCWLEYDILPSQDILVDAPHLISRFPTLLNKKEYNAKILDTICSFSEPNVLGLNPIIEPFRFSRKDWVSRPAWFWKDLRDNENIDEVKNPFKIRRLDQVFCEDISKFQSKDDTREFVADLNSPYVRRYVKQIDKIHYTPLVRFSL